MDAEHIRQHNRHAWNVQARMGIQWSTPVDRRAIELAKQGELQLYLSPSQAVPQNWISSIKGRRCLALAAGGGRQAILLAAAGVDVTLVDISEQQLSLDQTLAAEWKLDLKIHRAAADQLDFLSEQSFDLIILPLANCFFPELLPVWTHCARLLRPEGRLLFAFINPIAFSFDYLKAQSGIFELKYPVPYSDEHCLSAEERSRFVYPEVPLEFGHSLSDQLGLLLRSGFVIGDLFEDHWQPKEALDRFFPPLINVLAYRRPDLRS